MNQAGSGSSNQSGGVTAFSVLSPNLTYLGMTYGDIAGMWTNWLMSENPDYSYPLDIAYLRGNLKDYRDRNSLYDRRDPRVFEPSSSVLGNGMTIDTQTAVFVPIITTTFTREDTYEGIKLESDDGLRNAARAYLQGGGPIFATIQKAGDNTAKPLVDDLLKYKVVSPLFQLAVSDRNPFLNDLETPIKPDIHEAITAGYFILLKLTKGVYRIRFGGKGLGNYFTESIYDINVIDEKERTVKDITNDILKSGEGTGRKSTF